MAEALVSLVVELLGSIMARELEQEVRLVVGVEEEVKKLASNLSAIKAALADAETRQVKESTIRDWLEKLKDVAYDIEDMLEDWEAAILYPQKPERKVCSFLQSSCFRCKQVGLRHDIARKIKELNERLDQIAREKESYKLVSTEANQPIERPMTVSIEVTDVKGREKDKEVLVNMLLSEPDDGVRPDLRVFSLVGLGGIGKTTLAQFAFNHDRIKAHFDDNKFWVCVSDPYDEKRVAKAILTRLKVSTQDITELEDLLQKICESIKDKRFLLVLDDMWEENPTKWDRLKQSLKFGSPESKVLVTTRKENVASVMGCSNDDILKVGNLSDEECWLILSKIAFSGRSDIECNCLEEIGRKISMKCKGLPLAAKALGSTLRFRKTREQWQKILDSEMWGLKEIQEEVFRALWLSYFDLTPELKRCFSYCAIFPKDHEIRKSELIELWMAQGYLKGRQSDDLEIDGEYYFQNLAMRSFFQDFEYDNFLKRDMLSCKMHDIVHDFAQIVARNECGSVQVDNQVELIRKVRHLCLDLPKHGPYLNPSHGLKKYRSLFLWSEPTTEELSSLFSELTHVRSLSLRGGGCADIPPSIRKLIQLRWLDLSENSQLKQLPETLCELHSLQTIDVSRCHDLEKLPLGIGKLINLRHLHYGPGPTRLPKGIGQLTGLRTLEDVDVGCDDDDAFSLGDLKNLNQLRGTIHISGLGAYNRHVGEAKQAELKKKEQVTTLGLWFSASRGDEEELLLEALEPSPNLESLVIYLYKGTTFPSWMISLMNLRSIWLNGCESCERLPSLGKLPCLQTLILTEISGVKKVGKELLGIETQISDNKSEISASSSSSSVVVAFRKLTELEIHGMDNWEEWDDYYNDNYDDTTKHPPIIIMPSLHSLEIWDCPRLKALPNYILQSTMLHELGIYDCNLLEQRYNKEGGEDWSKISHISHAVVKMRR